MITVWGGSAQLIGNTDASYRNRNLIAGTLQLVTENVTLLANQGILECGTILGKNADGLYVVSKATATDGSQDPCAVLDDTYDTGTENLVNAGVYFMGEFNAKRVTYDESWTLDKLREATKKHSIFLKDVVTADPVS